MTNKELLIIGNGFDLSVGLKTTYKDFFEKRYSETLIYNLTDHFKLGHQISEEIKYIPNINFWDVFFLIKYVDVNNLDKNWSNIEEEIRVFLTNDKINNELGKLSLKKIIASNSNGNFDNMHRLKYSGYAIRLLMFLDKISNLTKDEFDDFLNSELILFESTFAEYIRNEVMQNNEYNEKSTNLIEALVTDLNETHVISFNYTDIQNENLISVENVHGKVDTGIIFGIDYKDLNYDSEEYKYSKTYRKLLSNVSNTHHQALPTEVKTVKFYGHSLSDADYSYFQSIFDFYDIYESNVIIEFFFYVFDEGNRKSIVANQLSSVTSLLSIYGGTMGNENHGKNLIHKLLLENRLKITETDSDGQSINT